MVYCPWGIKPATGTWFGEITWFQLRASLLIHEFSTIKGGFFLRVCVCVCEEWLLGRSTPLRVRPGMKLGTGYAGRHLSMPQDRTRGRGGRLA